MHIGTTTGGECENRTENLRTRLHSAHMRMSWREMERRAGCGSDTLRQFAMGATREPSLLTRLRLACEEEMLK